MDRQLSRLTLIVVMSMMLMMMTMIIMSMEMIHIDYISDCANISCPDLAVNVLCGGWPAPYTLLKTDGEQSSVLHK